MAVALDILFLIDDGIGNAIEMLYAVEHCIMNGRRTGVFLSKSSPSFVSYLRECYGSEVVLDGEGGVHATNLVHSWLYTERISASFDFYFLVAPNRQNTLRLSETEQYLSIVTALYPSDVKPSTLRLLREDYSERVMQLKVEEKYVLYPGCQAVNPVKRWPYYRELIEALGRERVLVVGGKEDLDRSLSFYYPRWLVACLPRRLLSRGRFAKLARRLGVLVPHSHLMGIEREPFSRFGEFSWAELVAILRRAKEIGRAHV